MRTRAISLRSDARRIAVDVAANFGADWPFTGEQEAIPPVRNQFYGHGAFMGAAPALLADAKWRKILAFLMPDVHEQVSVKVAKGARASALIPMFENNPVMCAFGVWATVRSRQQLGVPAGEHEMMIVKPGFNLSEQKITIEDGKVTRINITLQPF